MTNNDLGKKSGTVLSEMFRALKVSSISHLGLRNNDLYQRTGTEFSSLLSAIKDSPITHLDLSDNGLHLMVVTAFETLFDALKDTSVTHLNLCRNGIGYLDMFEMTAMFCSLQCTGVTHLDLGENSLELMTAEELAAIFGVFKDSRLIHLGLNDSYLNNRTTEDLHLIFNALPANIATIKLSLEELTEMSSEQRQTIQRRFPRAEQVILVNNVEGRELNSSLSLGDANVYRRLGFVGVSPPSLAGLTSFFLVGNNLRLTREVQKLLPDEVTERIVKNILG